MKKFIFGCVLMVCGIIGGTGWVIAAMSLVQPGAWSTAFNMFPIIGFGGPDGIVVILFYVLAIIGTVLAIKSMKEDK